MGWTGTWGWADFANEDNFVEVVVPSTGKHTFNVWMREDGVELDKIVLNIQAGTPSGLGPDQSERGPCSSQNLQTRNFSVEELGGNAGLNWGNFFEEFKDNYILERSLDGISYEILESEEIIVDKFSNEYTDPKIRQYGADKITYRLRIRDRSGQVRETRTGVLNLRSAFSAFDFKAYPNPATDKLTLEYDNSTGKDLKLEVMSALGQNLYTKEIEGVSTDGLIKLDVSDYAEGVYFVRMTDGEKNRVIRILVE